LATPAPYLDYTGENQAMLPLLHELGVTIDAGCVVDEIRDTVEGHLRAYPQERASWSADGVVLVTQRLPRTELYRGLCARRDSWAENGIEAMYRIGDCL